MERSSRWSLARGVGQAPLSDAVADQQSALISQYNIKAKTYLQKRQQDDDIAREEISAARSVLGRSGSTANEKMEAVQALQEWAYRHGSYDAEVGLLKALKLGREDLSAVAHMALKKHWEHHYDPMVLGVLDSAEVHLEAEEYSEALEIYNSVIREFPFWSHVYGLRAQVNNKLGEYDLAIKDLREALLLSPNNYTLMIQLGLLLKERRAAYAEAALLFGRARDLSGDSPVVPLSFFIDPLLEKAPEVKDKVDNATLKIKFSPAAPPDVLLPKRWVKLEEAVEEPTYVSARVGRSIEQWLTLLKLHKMPLDRQRELWDRLVVAWDPDVHPDKVQPFTEMVHARLMLRKPVETTLLDDSDDDIDDGSRLMELRLQEELFGD